MPDGGSSIFADSHGYQANLQDILDLLVLQPREFRARLTWADLPNLQLLRARETSGRVGYMTLPDDRVFVTFPTGKDSALIYGRVTVRFGDIMFHCRGERSHQRTVASSEWASIAMTPASLLDFGRTLAEQDLTAPGAGQVIRPRRADSRRLLRLHAHIGDIVEKNLDSMTNREVVRALEQDLAWALTSCLADGTVQESHTASGPQHAFLPSLEALLAAQPYRLLRTRDICANLGISKTTLQASCLVALGMGPGRYQRLRRLKRIRAELLHARRLAKHDVEAMVTRYGFANLHCFVTEHWRFYGEMPPIRSLDRMDR